jgi:hypothetical protein
MLRHDSAMKGPTAAALHRDGPWLRAESGLWLPVWVALPPLDDLALLTDLVRAGDRERLAALDRVIAGIAWVPRNRHVRRALEERALGDGCPVADVKQQELRAGVYLALAERGRPQPHRFGRAWLTDERGRALEVVPARLPPDLFRRWLADEARKAAEASLLGRAYPVTGWAPLAEAWDEAALDRLPGGGPDPLLLLVRREERAEAVDRWRELVGRATPRQRDLLGALADDVDAGAEANLAAVARRLGMAASTARVQWKRLVDRVNAPPG